MQIIKGLLVVLIGFNIAACAKHELKPQASFNIDDHKEYAGSGVASIKGIAYLDGIRILTTCAGNTVFLLPRTPYFTEVIEREKAHIKTKYSPEMIDQAKQVIRYTKCDMQGRFQFQSLPNAKWYVMAAVVLGEFPKQTKHILVKEVLSRGSEDSELKLIEPI